jgi:hypothetical protein
MEEQFWINSFLPEVVLKYEEESVVEGETGRQVQIKRGTNRKV